MTYSRSGWAGLLGMLACLSCGDDEGAGVVPDASSSAPAPSNSGTSDAGASGSDAGGTETDSGAEDVLDAATTLDASALDAAADAKVDGADAGDSAPAVDPGALVGVVIESQVGVVLDEIPNANRAELVAYLNAQDDSFWVARANAQVALMGYRLVFRNFFYDEEEGRMQLPLPPQELWNITITSDPAFVTVDNHDVLSVDFELVTTLLSPYDSPGKAEPELALIGGVWDEPFILPIDPELLLQRTGYACMDEEEFPPNSVDAENVFTFYDHECEPAVTEDETSNTDCHITEHPTESCVEALERAVGKVEPLVRFTRLEWDEEFANEVRWGAITNPTGADLDVMGQGLENNRIIYRYIAEDSCAIAEGCVSGTGWRRLLQFDASVHNLGAEALDIGNVDYYLEGTGTPLGDHNIFQYSDCHQHYHFSHYGDFVLESGDGVLGNKQAFCLQSTNRYSNNEFAPLTHPYGSCDYQGMQAGWGDDYGAGIECQWIDITGVPADSVDLSFVANPDGFLCEGAPILDEEGQLTFEPTEFETPAGDPVDRPACEFLPEWEQNNTEQRPLTVPEQGGLINTPCMRGQVGPLRDCGFEVAEVPESIIECEPGVTVTLDCTVPDGEPAVVLRACNYSEVLGQGVACVFREAFANEIVGPGTSSVEATCPQALDDTEPGGKLSLYVAPLLPMNQVGAITCTVAE